MMSNHSLFKDSFGIKFLFDSDRSMLTIYSEDPIKPKFKLLRISYKDGIVIYSR